MIRKTLETEPQKYFHPEYPPKEYYPPEQYSLPTAGSTLRVELGISAQRIIHQLQLQNQSLEEVITKGIEQAFEEISKEGNLQDMISAQTKQEIKRIISDVVFDFQFKNKIREAIVEKMGKKIDEYSTKIAERLTKNL